MPPEVGISDWSSGSGKDQQDEEEDQQPAIKAKERAFTQLEIFGRVTLPRIDKSSLIRTVDAYC